MRTDELLERALAPVLRDLATSRLVQPNVEESDWTGDRDRPSVMLWSRDGSGRGAAVSRSDPSAAQVSKMAEHVQEWLIEELWSHALANWPPCPQHPRTHPMQAAVRDGKAVWIGPGDGAVAALIGSLPTIQRLAGVSVAPGCTELGSPQCGFIR